MIKKFILKKIIEKIWLKSTKTKIKLLIEIKPPFIVMTLKWVY